MTYLAELLIDGVSLGFIYALITLGFVVMFKATGVFNFAQGSMTLLGAYIVARLHSAIGFVPALLVGLTAAAGAALVIERVLISRPKRADMTSVGILTIGVDTLLATELARRIGQGVLSVGDPWSNNAVTIGPIVIPAARVAAMCISIVLMSLFFAAIKFSGWGVAMRATAEDGEAAALMGIRRGRVSATAWMLSGALATVAGVFLGTAPSPGLTSGSNLIALNAIPAAVVGGLDSIPGAVVGGVVIGVVESLASGYNAQLSFLGSPLSDVSAYVVMLLVLLWRPSGLLGTRDIARV